LIPCNPFQRAGRAQRGKLSPPDALTPSLCILDGRTKLFHIRRNLGPAVVDEIVVLFDRDIGEIVMDDVEASFVMPSAFAFEVMTFANSSSLPPIASATTTAASFADLVTSPFIASSTVIVWLALSQR
jgi:ABC-type polysaccharide transport system permease subunit